MHYLSIKIEDFPHPLHSGKVIFIINNVRSLTLTKWQHNQWEFILHAPLLMLNNSKSLMKKLNYFFAIAMTLSLFSCEKEEVSPTIHSGDLSMIDPATPAGIQPLILDDGLKAAPSGYTLVWSDEFNSFDSNKWTILESSKSRNPRPKKGIKDWYWKTDEVAYQNGRVRLKARKIDHNTLHCGSINSNNKYETKFGYFEARIANAATSKAVHTAFWFQGDNMGSKDRTGRDGAEIDVYESAWNGNYTKSVVHIDGYGSAHQANTKQWSAPGIHSGFHTYGLRWTPTQLKVYYDGVGKATYGGSKWIPQVEEYLWLSVGASFADGDFVNQPVGFLTMAYVDWVRVYKN